MKQLFTISLFISFFLFFGSCSKFSDELNTPLNSEIKLTTLKSTKFKPLKNSDIHSQQFILQNKELILSYINSSILINGKKVENLFSEINVNSEDTKNLIIDKILVFEYYKNTSETGTRATKKPSNEEVRDAMLRECDKHIEPIETGCKAAVWIAYWYHEIK